MSARNPKAKAPPRHACEGGHLMKSRSSNLHCMRAAPCTQRGKNLSLDTRPFATLLRSYSGALLGTIGEIAVHPEQPQSGVSKGARANGSLPYWPANTLKVRAGAGQAGSRSRQPLPNGRPPGLGRRFELSGGGPIG